MTNRFSKREGLRKEDLPYYKLVEKNRPVIRGLMNHLTGGALSRARSRPADEAGAGTKSFHIGKATNANEPGRPIVHISFNNRVLVIDDVHSKQLLHLGNLVRAAEGTKFLLATKENDFFAPVEAAIQEVLKDLDGSILSEQFSQDRLVSEITSRLSLDDENPE
jgi:hypothetical protein